MHLNFAMLFTLLLSQAFLEEMGLEPDESATTPIPVTSPIGSPTAMTMMSLSNASSPNERDAVLEGIHFPMLGLNEGLLVD